MFKTVVECCEWPTLIMLVSTVWQLESLSLQWSRHLCFSPPNYQHCPLWHCSYKRIASDPKINHFFEGKHMRGVTCWETRALQAMCPALVA